MVVKPGSFVNGHASDTPWSEKHNTSRARRAANEHSENQKPRALRRRHQCARARDAIIAAHGNSLALAISHVLFEMTGWGALASCLGSTRCHPKPTSAPPQMHPALIIPIVSEVIG
jgi:hypothetical protein